MKKNIFGGLFVAIDGVKGVGKTTLVEQVYKTLKSDGINACCTQEPTNTARGDFVRRTAATLGGDGLACFVAADRYFHLEEDVIPRLKNNEVVITDRYALSSLLFQKMDGVETDFILDINKNVICPDIQIVVVSDLKTIKKRLDSREVKQDRFENANQTSREMNLLSEGAQIFMDLGVNVMVIENASSIQSAALIVVESIRKALA